MEITQLHKIKAMLPIEVTAAFIAIQKIVNGKPLPANAGGGFEGANDHHTLMAATIIILLAANVALLRRGGIRDLFSIFFSSLGFLIWAVTLDEIRWQDQISQVGITPETSVILLPIFAVFYSLAAAIFSTNAKLPASGPASPPVLDPASQ